eukprot:m.307652 g.307652  ORF g.307652 m.307652 type:complete len:212 (+) comp42584_c0_seq1:35-670(+)
MTTIGRCFRRASFLFQTRIKPRQISRYPIPAPDTLPTDIKSQMDEVAEKSGFVPNVFRALAHRPDEFRSFFQFYETVVTKENNLTKAEKEMIIVATSSANECNYCVTAHGAILRIYSKAPPLSEQIATNYKMADITDRQKAMLEFALVVAKGKDVSDEAFAKLEKHGIDKETAWDVGSIAALFALSNRMAHLMALKPNEEFYYMGRELKKR